MRILPLATSLLLVVPSLASAEVLWRGDFETGNISQWNGRPQRVSADRLQVVDSPVHQGRHALQVTVRQGDDPINASGNRAELVRTNGNEVEGAEYFYRWSTMFAEDFPAPDTWQLFVQWHHTGNSGSPPVEFVIRKDTLRLAVGGNPSTTVWSAPLVRGVWHEFVFHVRWSSDPRKGFVELYHNRELVLPRRYIATMFEGQSNYMKAGLYRNDTIAPVGRLWHDGFMQATTLADVMPPAPAPEPTPQPTPDAGTPPSGNEGRTPDTGTAPGGGSPTPDSPSVQEPAPSPAPLPEPPAPEEDALGCAASGATPAASLLLALVGLALRRRARG